MSAQTNNHRVDRLLRLSEVLQLVPIGKTTWYKGVKTGVYPSPVQIGPRVTAWRLSDIERLMEAGAPCSPE